MRYAIVYFGSPEKLVGRTCATERRAIWLAKSAKGTGSCTAARVYACDTVALANTADISVIRDGERVVFEA